MNNILKLYTTTNKELNKIPIKNNQLIYVNDQKRFYIDRNGLRLDYSVIAILKNEKDRKNLSFPMNGFYFVEDTLKMWRYFQEKWMEITPKNNNTFFFGNYNSFPISGDSSVFYCTEDAFYKWNNLKKKYEIISNNIEWETI